MTAKDTAPGGAVDDADLDTDTDTAGDALWAEMAADRKPEGTEAAAPPPADEGDEYDGDPAGAAAPPADDAWAGASEAQRSAFAAAQARAEAAEQRIRSDEGRVRAYQQQVENLKRKSAAPAAGTTKDDGLKLIAEDYPEIVNPIMERFAALEGALTGVTDGQRAAAEAATLANNEAELTEIHPDWLTLRADPRLAAWIGTQPNYVREAAETNGNAIVDVDAAADLVSRFKQSIGIAPAGSTAANARPTSATHTTMAPTNADRRRRQLEASTGAGMRSGPAAQGGIPDDPDAQWAFFKAKREREEAAHR